MLKMTEQYLSSKIGIKKRFQRSTNLGVDFSESDFLNGFVLQRNAVNCLDSMARYIEETNQRAFTWTGSYGSGKSSLALFLYSLLAAGTQNQRKARAILKASSFDVKRIKKVLNPAHAYRVITLVGRKGSLEKDFVAVAQTQAQDGRGCIKELIDAVQSEQEHGIIIFIDELGKYLENGDDDNCYFLQELAEAANRTNARFIVVGILHQSFDAYTNSLTKLQRDEWAKVQGRYVDLPILSAPDEVLQLISQSVESQLEALPTFIDKPIEMVIKEFSKTRNLDKESMENTLRSVYPLNPVSACLLGVISRHSFLQNTRSVFNFLNSREPYSFYDFLSTTTVGDKKLYNLDVLWDYLEANYEQAIIASGTDGHRWILATECIDRARRLDSKVAVAVAKAISVFELFKRGSGLESSKELIAACLAPIPTQEVQKALDSLIQAKVVVYRKYSSSYTLFEGTDFELDKELADTLKQIDAIDIDCLNHLVKLTPVIARRHYAKTGTLRWLERSIGIIDGKNIEYLPPEDRNSAGRLILCVGSIKEKDFVRCIQNELRDKNQFFALSSASESILLKAKELQALDLIEKNPSIEGDATARKEINLRKELLTSQLIEELVESFSHTQWYGRGVKKTVSSTTGLNSLVSDICDNLFRSAPVINNELFNREQLSSNISRARKVLLLSMLNNTKLERLGIEGYPPEAMLYMSVLKAAGMHKKDDVSDQYYFEARIDNPSYGKLWQATHAFFKDNEKPSLQELYDFWGKEPFGLKSGIKPVLAMVYFLANVNELSIYVNGAIQPEFNEDVLEHWNVDPREVTFRYIKTTNEKGELLQKLSSALNTFKDIECDETPLSIARAIVRIVLTCPKWALTTMQLDEITKEFRNTVVKAWDPLELIFVDLPRIYKTDYTDELVEKVTASLQEILSVTPEMLNRVKAFLLSAIDHDGDFSELQRRAESIRGTAGQMQLEAFITRMSTYNGSDPQTEGVISLAVGKNKLQWTDRDIDLAMNKIADWALSFRHLEGMSLLRNREANRRVIGLVVGGQSGANQDIIDLPTKHNDALQQANDQLEKILKQLPRDVALSALIDQSLALLKDNK